MSKDARDMLVRMMDAKYGAAIRVIVMDILHDPDIVEDIKQEVFFSCTKRVDLLNSMNEKQMLSYLCTAARNYCINEYHRRNKMQKTQAEYAEHVHLLMDDHIDFVAFENQYGFSDETMQLLKLLNPEDRAIMIYRFHHELLLAEIGEILGLSEEAVKKRYQRARKKMIAFLEEGSEDDEK